MAANKEELKQLNMGSHKYSELDMADEINLFDLWLVIEKRRYIFYVVFIVCVLLGLSYAFVKPDKYEFSTSIEIGTKIQGAGYVSIESPVSVLDKIKKVYIPLAISKYINGNSGTDYIPNVSADLGKGSSIVNIKIKAADDHQAVSFLLLEEIADSIRKDHQRMFLVERKEIELVRNKINNQISKLKEEGELLKAQNIRLKEKSKLIEKQIKNIKKLISDSEPAKKEAMRRADTEGQALAIMMIDNDLRQANQILAKLQEGLYITIEDEKDMLVNKMAENIRLQSEQQDQLSKIETQLVNMLETRAIVKPMKSIKPVGQSKKLIVLLSVFAGLFISLFVMFGFEFIEKARNYAAEKNQSV